MVKALWQKEIDKFDKETNKSNKKYQARHINYGLTPQDFSNFLQNQPKEVIRDPLIKIDRALASYWRLYNKKDPLSRTKALKVGERVCKLVSSLCNFQPFFSVYLACKQGENMQDCLCRINKAIDEVKEQYKLNKEIYKYGFNEWLVRN